MRFTFSLVENTLESELGKTFVKVRRGADFKEPVGGSVGIWVVQRRVSASDQDGRWRFFENNEVVRYLGPFLVRRGLEILGCP